MASARECGIGPEPGLHGERVVRAVPVQGQEEPLTADEVRCDDLHERAPLPMGLPDEANVAEAQVAEAPVDELRRSARGLGAEIRAVDKRDRETGAGRLAGDPGADDAAADHEEVEALRLQPLEGLTPVYDTHNGFVQARRPSSSRSSSRPYGVKAGRSRRAA